MNFFFEIFLSIFDIKNWLWKYDFGTFWRTGISCRIFLNKIPFSMLILGQKPCILDPTFFKIPQPNWHYWVCAQTKNLQKSGRKNCQKRSGGSNCPICKMLVLYRTGTEVQSWPQQIKSIFLLVLLNGMYTFLSE